MERGGSRGGGGIGRVSVRGLRPTRQKPHIFFDKACLWGSDSGVCVWGGYPSAGLDIAISSTTSLGRDDRVSFSLSYSSLLLAMG